MIRRTRPSFATISYKRPARRRLACGGATLVLLAALVLSLASVASGAPKAAKVFPPAAPTKVLVKSASFKSVTVSWSASQSRTRLIRYFVYKNGTRLATTSALSYTVGGLLCGKSYTLGVASVTLTGVRSAIVSVIASTSPCPDANAPTAPTAVTQITATATSATVSWAKSTDVAGVAGYSVFRSGVPVGMTAGTSYTFTGLLCGASYPAAVDAFDAAGNHSGQAAYVISASPCAAVPDTQPPSVPQAQRITGAGQTTVEMAWNASTDNVRVAGYELWLDNAKVGTTTGTTYTYTGLGCGTTHTVGLVAYDAAGNRSDRAAASGPASTSACPAPAPPAPAPSAPAPASPPPSSPPPPPADVQAPSTPTAASVTAATLTSITIAWHASTDNVAVTGYGVYRGSQVGSTAGTSYTVTGLSCGSSYTLGVDAYDAAGNRSAKAVVSAATSTCPDTQPPTQPANVAQTNRTETSLSIRWDASSDTTGVVGYALFKAGAQVANVTGTTYTFTGLTCNTSYTLGIDAYDASANHSTRTSVMMTTSPCMDTQAPSVPQGQQIAGTTQTTIAMSWAASTDNVGVTGYEVWLDDVKVATTTSLAFTYTSLACGTSHTVGLVAYDAAGNKSDRALATGSASTAACSTPTPPPPAPTPPPPAPTPPATPGSANLWVDTSGGSCVRQASAGGWVDAQACSWNQAYQAAQTGDVILVRGGNYGNVDIGPNKASIASPGVTFRTAAGESVVVGDLENGHIGNGGGGASNITFVGPVTARTFRSDGNNNITVDNWTIDCGGCDGVQIFHLEDSSNVTVKNSDISDNKNNSLMWVNGTNLTFENNRIHDAGLPSGSGAHTECLYAWDVTNLTLKRNHFYHCSVMDVFITGSSVANGGYVENNVFEKPWENTGVISNSAFAFHFRNGGSPSPDPSNWDFRYNTFVGPLSITPSENPVAAGGLRVVGNVFLAGGPCGLSNTTYAFNAFVSGACGTNSITFSLATYLSGFTSTSDPGTYSLLPASVLRDKGSPTDYPSIDKAGNARYSGTAPNIGAFE